MGEQRKVQHEGVLRVSISTYEQNYHILGRAIIRFGVLMILAALILAGGLVITAAIIAGAVS